MGSDCAVPTCAVPNTTFQSTLPYGERQGPAGKDGDPGRFNPRSRMGSDNAEDPYWYFTEVSIHAPVWGATKVLGINDSGQVVSIHAPVWGATQHAAVHYLLYVVSIHAPVWGAT